MGIRASRERFRQIRSVGLRLPCVGGFDKGAEQLARERAGVEGSFWVPLDAENKGSAGRAFGCFEGFDGAIERADGDGLKLVADTGDRLVMAGVDQDRRFGGLRCRDELREKGPGNDGDRMSLGDMAARRVVHGGFEMLDERAATPHVHRLHSVADAEDGLLQVEGILKQQLVGGFAERVGRGGAGIERLAELFGVHVGMTARQQHTLRIGDQPGLFLLCGMKRNGDRDAAGLLDCRGVLSPAALVVLGVVGSGLGNKDAGFGH